MNRKMPRHVAHNGSKGPNPASSHGPLRWWHQGCPSAARGELQGLSFRGPFLTPGLEPRVFALERAAQRSGQERPPKHRQSPLRIDSKDTSGAGLYGGHFVRAAHPNTPNAARPREAFAGFQSGDGPPGRGESGLLDERRTAHGEFTVIETLDGRYGGRPLGPVYNIYGDFPHHRSRGLYQLDVFHFHTTNIQKGRMVCIFVLPGPG